MDNLKAGRNILNPENQCLLGIIIEEICELVADVLSQAPSARIASYSARRTSAHLSDTLRPDILPFDDKALKL